MNTEIVHTLYNIYSDKSYHLQHERQPVMALGAICCPKNEAPCLSSEVRAIKNRYRAQGNYRLHRQGCLQAALRRGVTP